jgi:hypothetical protein
MDTAFFRQGAWATIAVLSFIGVINTSSVPTPLVTWASVISAGKVGIVGLFMRLITNLPDAFKQEPLSANASFDNAYKGGVTIDTNGGTTVTCEVPKVRYWQYHHR